MLVLLTVCLGCYFALETLIQACLPNSAVSMVKLVTDDALKSLPNGLQIDMQLRQTTPCLR